MKRVHDDDRQIGRILSRREVLALFGVVGAGLLASCAAPITATVAPTLQPATVVPPASTATIAAAKPTLAPSAPTTTVSAPTPQAPASTAASNVAALPACVVRPEVTEGPYYVDENLNRADIRSDPGTSVVKEGGLLTLTFRVSQIAGGGCTPLPNAKVDIWHCDAAGVYSDVTDRTFSTKGQKFLRGFQMTDANGVATFTTIYPGWYPGRAIHIHFKVSPTANTVLTSQVFFDDAFSDQVLLQAPYSAKTGRRTLNSTDGIYKPQLLAAAARVANGYAATFDIGVQMG